MPAPHCPHCAAPATCPDCACCAAHCTCAPHPPAPAAALSPAARADLIQGHLPPGVTAFVELDAWVSIDTPDPTGRPTILEGDGVTGQAVATLWHVITSQATELTTLRAQIGAAPVPDAQAARTHRWLTLRGHLTTLFERLGCYDQHGEWLDTEDAQHWRALTHQIYAAADRLGRLNRHAPGSGH